MLYKQKVYSHGLAMLAWGFGVDLALAQPSDWTGTCGSFSLPSTALGNGCSDLKLRSAFPDSASKGAWSCPKQLKINTGIGPTDNPMEAIHSILVYDWVHKKARVLCVDWFNFKNEQIGTPAVYLTPRVVLFDPADCSIRNAENSLQGGQDLFCSGHTFTSNGALLFSGGGRFECGEIEGEAPDQHIVRETMPEFRVTLYDPTGSTGGAQVGCWGTAQEELWFDPLPPAYSPPLSSEHRNRRWYPTVTRRHNGELLIADGRCFVTQYPEWPEYGRPTMVVKYIPPTTNICSGALGTFSPIVLSEYGRGDTASPLVSNYQKGWSLRYYPQMFTAAMVGGGNGPLVHRVFYAGSTYQNPAPLQNPCTPPDYSGTLANCDMASRTFNPESNGGPCTTTTQLPFASGTAVMYQHNKVLIVGGPDREIGNECGPEVFGLKSAATITLDAATPTWSLVSSMATRRVYHNAVALPDGTICVVGGNSGGTAAQSNPRQNCSVCDTVLEAEIWDPATDTWTTMNPMVYPRMYHSSACLLPDASLFCSGGQANATAVVPANCPDGMLYDIDGAGPDPIGITREEQRTYEIFYPPYFFQGARPTIYNMTYGTTGGSPPECSPCETSPDQA